MSDYYIEFAEGRYFAGFEDHTLRPRFTGDLRTAVFFNTQDDAEFTVEVMRKRRLGDGARVQLRSGKS